VGPAKGAAHRVSDGFRRGKASALYLVIDRFCINIFPVCLGRTHDKGEEQPVAALEPMSLNVRLALFLQTCSIEVGRYLMASLCEMSLYRQG